MWSASRLCVFVVLAVLAGSFGCGRRGEQQTATSSNGEDQQAAEVIRQVSAAYDSLSSYSDSGTVVDRSASRAQGLILTVSFETLLKKPNKLRFQWRVESSSVPGYGERAVVWSDGRSSWSSNSARGNKRERERTLELAVSGATGSSLGAAYLIPGLLCEEVRGFRLDYLQNARVKGDEAVDDVECIVLVGHLAPDKECTVWVGRKDHLIRRIEERSKGGTRIETLRQIIVNADIRDSRFSEQG